jgi:hypothetical protein
MIAATTCKKRSRAKKRLASDLREQREAHCTSYARCELRERGRRDGSCLHPRNDDRRVNAPKKAWSRER